ncbi:polyprenyl synthetase family protein [Streptomyces sp. NPDC005805]|uniref:polyprenyl synthetase family protein n=1 Tax=Streptomyces sp. NPDC005805 TaxID=3157068 RepID=UPI0033CF1F4F
MSHLASPLDMVAAYHFGWSDRRGRPTTGGGKMLRPALAVLSAQAIGGKHEADVLLNGSIHDTQLCDQARAVRRLTTASRRLIDGQARDLAFERRAQISVQDCLDMEGAKTGALLGCATAIGAVLASAHDATADSLERYGHHLGLVFHTIDDLMGFWGDPKSTGKTRWSDLRRNKKSLPVCAALAERGTASRQLAQLITSAHSGNETEQELAQHAELIEAVVGRDWTQQGARRQHEKVLDSLDEVSIPDEVREHFVALTKFAVERER